MRFLFALFAACMLFASSAEAGSGDAPRTIDTSKILPLVKDRQWLADIANTVKARGAQFSPLYDDLNPELIIVYAEDQPERTRFIEEKEVKLSKAALRTLAIANLRKSLPKIEMRDLGPVAFLSVGGDYEASLLLLDDIWSDGQIKRKGETLVAIPGHDTLLVSGTEEPEGLEAFLKLVKSLGASARKPLTNTLFVYRGGRFVKYEAK